MEEKPVTAFLEFYQNESTRWNYQNAIYRYLICFYPELTRNLDEMDRVAAAYLAELRTSRNLLTDLAYSVNQMKTMYAPTYVNLNLRVLCLWFDDNQAGITRRIRQRVFNLVPPAYSIREEAELTRSLLKRIYRALPDWCRVRPAVRVRAEHSKNKIPRITYMTKEAEDALRSYLTSRSDDDPRVFPYTVGCAQSLLRKSLDKAGWGPVNGEARRFHWHMTRKWFISRFSLVASKEVAEELAGHVGYLSRSYQRFTRRQILAQFKKADSYLSVLGGK